MTTSEYNQIKEIFKSAKSIDELQRIDNDIFEITTILSTVPFNIEAARKKITSINTEHAENCLFFCLINPPNGKAVSVHSASPNNLIQDLAWKKLYLSVKAKAKTLDEIIRQLASLYNRKL